MIFSPRGEGGVAEEAPETEWQKLPARVQYQFYGLAEEESVFQDRLIEEMVTKARKIRDEVLAEAEVEPERAPSGDWEKLSVLAVDGSCSPSLERRLARQYGVFVVGWQLWKGHKAVEDAFDFASGYISAGYDAFSDAPRAALGMVMVCLERAMALEALEGTGADFAMIDGSLFGAVAPAAVLSAPESKDFPLDCIKVALGDQVAPFPDLDLPCPPPRTAGGLPKLYVELTRKLRETGRVFSAVKRTKYRALDGLSLAKNADFIDKRAPTVDEAWKAVRKVVSGMIDKAIASLVLRKGEVLRYSDAFPEPWEFRPYSLMVFYVLRKGDRQSRPGIMAKLEDAKKHTIKAWCENLFGRRINPKTYRAANAAQLATRLPPVFRRGIDRVFLKASEEAPACALELPKDLTDREAALSWAYGFANPQTGHPFPLDLIDETVRAPRKLAREFADEVTAKLLEGKLPTERKNIYRLFQLLNPQDIWK